jgi:Big-like domain-containing protein/cadherin-like protein
LLGSILATAPAAGAVTLDGARTKALRATKAERARDGVILFGLRVPIRARASIRESGRTPAPAGSSRRVMPTVLRAGSEPAFFFYLDRGAYQASPHAGRVVLVGARSGRVVRSRALRFAPAIDGRLPVFLRSRAGYDAARYRVAASDYAVAGAAARAARAGLGSFGAAAPRSAASEGAVAASLAAEHSCTVAIGGRPWNAVRTFGSASGSAILPLLLYDPARRTSLRSFVASEAIAKRGCRDILVAISGDGYRKLPTPTVRTRLTTAGKRMREYHVSAAMLRSLIGANPSVTFKLLIDAPGSGGFIESLKSLSNVLVVSTSSTAAQTAYRYLPRKRIGGELTGNPLHRRSDSSFLTTMLFGGAAFAASDVEVGHAAAEVAAGRAPSFFAYLVARAFALSRPFDFTADLGATQRLYVHGFTPTPPGPSNGAPVATPQSVTTTQDTAKAITLAGSDPDGDPLTFAIAAAPTHGTLGGTAPNVTYTPAAGYEGPDSLTFTVSDGSLTSAAATVAIAVSAVDDPPVTSAGGTLAYAENDPPTAIAPSLTVLDGDSSSLTGATVQITANLEAGADVLALAPQPGLTISYDAPTGTLTLSGTATVAVYQAALRAVTYANTSDDPSSAARTVAFRARDAGGFGPPSTSTITVAPVNDPPAILTSSGPLSYTENDPATPVDGGLALSDPDSQITGASVQITNNHASPQDILALASPPAGIAAAYDSATGKLTLSGTATVAAYQAALRAVTYRNSSSSPTTALRTVTFLASDASSTSAPATRAIAVNAPDNAPDVSADSAAALLYTENQAATAVEPAITITDLDSVDLTGATAQIAGSYAEGEDVLDTPPGLPGGIAAAFDAPSGRLTLSGIASIANYEAALEAVRYRNTSDAPSTAARTVTFQARDAGGFGTTDSRTITVLAVDDAPVAVNDGATVAEESGASAVAVIANDTDVDGGPKSIGSVTQPANGTVVVTGGGTGLTYAPNADYCNTPPGTALDTFTYALAPGGSTATVSMAVTCVDDAPVAVNDSATVGEDSGANAIAVLGNDVDVDGGPRSVASVTQPANGVVAITGGGTAVSYAPNANYCNTPPGTTPDTFTYTLTPGASAATVSMAVTCGDDPPVAVDDGAAVGEDSGAGAVDVLANDTDADGGPKSVISVTQPANGAVVVTGGGTGVTYAPNANYCNSPPGGAPDVFTYTLDGGDVGSVAMTVTCAGDAPVVDNSGPPLAYGENDAPSPIDAGVTVTDPDVGAAIVGATVQITANYAGAQDVLALNDAVVHLPITAIVTADTITLSGAASPAAYEAALRDVTYFNGSEAPSTLPRTATFTVTDDAALSGSDARAIVVASVDDDPAAVDDGATVLEDAGATAIAVLTNDTDLDGGPKAIGSTGQPASGAVVITGGGTGLSYEPDPNYCNDPPGTTPDTFTYTLSPGGSTATVSMTVTCVNDAPVADDDPFGDALGNTRFVVGTTSSGPRLTVAGDVLNGDTDVDTPSGLTAGPASITSTQCAGTCTGNVTMESDGQFTYDPKPGFTGTDTFTYTVADNDAQAPANLTDTGTVTITVVGPLVWFVDGNAGPAGDGRSHTPSKTLSALSTGGSLDGLDGSGDVIFVRGAASSYAGGLALEASQRLIGEPQSLDVDPAGPTPLQNDIVPAGGSNPQIVNGSGNGLTLSTANTIQAIDLGNASGAALFGTGVSSATMNTTTPGAINNATVGGRAVDVSGGTLGMAFSAVSATGGAQGIRLDNTAGTFSAGGGTLSSATGTDVVISGNDSADSVDFTYGGAITDDSGQLVSISDQSGGTKDFNGAITDVPATPNNGGGISVQSNSASTTTRFDGGLTLSTGTSNAIAASSGGTLAITDSDGPGAGADNTVVSTTGTPLNLLNTTIHDDDLTFRSISSNGAPSGIVLNTTANPVGRLVVTGNGGSCTSAGTCTGGAIQSSSAPGVALTNVPGGVSLTRTAVTSGGDDGIRATTVNDVDLADSIVTNNGNSHAGGAEERGLDYLNVTGTPQILRTTVSGSDDSNAHVRNTVAGTTALAVNQSTFTNSKFNSGLRLRGEGPSVMNATVTGSVFSLNADPGFSMQTDAVNTAQQTLLFDNNDVSGGSSNAVSARPQVSINADGASTVKATVTNNDIKSAAGAEVILNTLANHTGTFDAKVNGNDINDSQPGALDALADGGSAIWGWAHGDGVSRVEIRNNNVANWGGRGMELSHNDGTGDADYTVTGNVLSAPDVSPNTFEGMYILSGGAGGDASDVCVDMENNDVDGIGRQGVSDVALDRFAGNLLRFADFNDTSVANLQTNLRAKNPASPALTVETFSLAPSATTETACDLPIGTP